MHIDVTQHISAVARQVSSRIENGQEARAVAARAAASRTTAAFTGS